MQATAASPDVVLRLSGLRKCYGDLVAVKGLSLDVLRGEVLGLLGPNGAGKTTTISMICGLLRADAGDVTVNGERQGSHRERQRLLGFCPQEIVVWESLTCFEQLEFMGRLYDLDRDAARRRASELLSILCLDQERQKLAGTLSGGMKRRLNIALALMHDPEILILDEPQAGLDPQSRILVREYVRSLAKKTTVIVTTHDMDEADRLADRIAIMDHGQLLVLDTAENLKDRVGSGEILEIKVPRDQKDRLARLQEDPADDLQNLTLREGTLRLVATDILSVLPALLRRVQKNHLRIEGMTIRKRTLEDVFIALTGRSLRG